MNVKDPLQENQTQKIRLDLLTLNNLGNCKEFPENLMSSEPSEKILFQWKHFVNAMR